MIGLCNNRKHCNNMLSTTTENGFTREEGEQLVGCLAFCLKTDHTRGLFGWFSLTDAEEKVLLKALKKLLGATMELDMKGLRRMLETFLNLTEPNKMNDRNRDSWMKVANEESKIKDLPLNPAGRRIWYESLREEGDEEWREDGAEPRKDKQNFLTKLKKGS